MVNRIKEPKSRCNRARSRECPRPTGSLVDGVPDSEQPSARLFRGKIRRCGPGTSHRWSKAAMTISFLANRLKYVTSFPISPFRFPLSLCFLSFLFCPVHLFLFVSFLFILEKRTLALCMPCSASRLLFPLSHLPSFLCYQRHTPFFITLISLPI